MSGQHTPGPWVLADNGMGVIRGGVVRQYANGSTQDQIVMACSVTDDNGCMKANARLIAAAPELLEALQMGVSETLDYIQRNHLSGAENNHWIVQAKAAIAKATGEQP